MEEFIFASLVVAVALGAHAAVLRNHSSQEGRLLTLSFAMHMVGGLGQVLITQYYFGGGDMMGYYETGVPMADAMRSDLPLFGPALVEGFFRLDTISAPIEFMPGGGSTQSMSAVAIGLLFLLGNSLYAVTLLIATLSYLSKVLLYRALKSDLLHSERLVLIGVTMLPSAVFWSCGLLKEPVVMVALGPLVLGLRWLLLRYRRGWAVLLVVLGATVVSVIKPYVLMALSIAAGLFYFWSRLFSRDSAALKPFALVVAGVIGSSGFVLGNRYFVKSENEDTVSSLSRQRQAGYGVEGGSNFSIEIGPEQEVGSRSVGYELLLAPLAVFTALFRPLLFEARNVVQLANAIEATVLLVFFVQILRRLGLKGMFREVLGSPTLLFCAVFTLALALGTGLATTNMGTLSRYRTPMMPFFFVLLLVLRQKAVRTPDNAQAPFSSAVVGR